MKRAYYSDEAFISSVRSMYPNKHILVLPLVIEEKARNAVQTIKMHQKLCITFTQGTNHGSTFMNPKPSAINSVGLLN